MVPVPRAPVVLNKDDPLCGVLEEEQVGLDPLSGRPKIAKEVLDEMRRYLLAETGENRAVKIDRIRGTVKEAEADPIAQRAVLRLEPAPVVTSDLNRGKGLVFDYDEKSQRKVDFDLNANPNKLMAGAFKAFKASPATSAPILDLSTGEESSSASDHRFFSDSSTVFHSGYLRPGTSGTISRKPRVRRRPPKGVLKASSLGLVTRCQEPEENRREGKHEEGSRKMKKVMEDT